MPPFKDTNQVLADVHDDAANALRTTAAGSGVTPVTVLRSDTTGVAAINITTAFAKKMQILSIRGKASAPVAEACSIKLDSKAGAAYDNEETNVAAGWRDFKYQPDGEDILEAGDEISITCPNTGGATYGITVIAKELS